jgi:hypothetical protein
MALIQGVAGIGYFSHEWYPASDDRALLNDIQMAAAAGQINAEIPFWMGTF